MKIGIIGAGACGLVLANILEKNHIEYELFERGLCGRKILASGNGKANIGNIHINSKSYNDSFAYQLVKEYYPKLMDFFREIHLSIKVDNEGRIYPFSESSASVLSCLTNTPLKIIQNYSVQSIHKLNHKYYLNDVRGPFDYLVLSTGSMASFIPKKQNGFYDFLSSLNLTIQKPSPSLVGFKLKTNVNRLNGTRVKCMAGLYQEGQLIHEEEGEVIFKSDGISGICILNLSFFYNQLVNHDSCQIRLNLIYHTDTQVHCLEDLMGLVPPKLYEYFKNLSIEEINAQLKCFSLEILEPYDFEFAQVVSGGIALDEVDEHLRLRKDSSIFCGGELMDVDGMCGGYNLMYAFCCGIKIGEELCNIK